MIFKVDKPIQLTKNIWLHELACHDEDNSLNHESELVYVLQNFIDKMEVELKQYVYVIITSAYRTPEYNAKLKNASPNSQHIYGRAVDCKFYTLDADGIKTQIPPEFVHQMAQDMSLFTGMGLYDTFNHLDIRRNRFSVFDLRTGK